MEHMYELKNTDTIISPSLIYYEEIIRENIKKAIRTAGSPERLWPHVKSHKSKDMVRMQMEYGITKFKTATVAEAEMAAEAGAEKVILAYPLIGPNMERFVKLAKAYPDTVFYGVEDDLAQFEALSGVCVEHNAVLPMLVDECTVNGGVYGFPIDAQVKATFYNKKMFDEAGVEVPKTKDDFFKVCDTFMDKGIYPMIHPYNFIHGVFHELDSFFTSMAAGTGNENVWMDSQNGVKDLSGNPVVVEAMEMFSKFASYKDAGDTAVDQTQGIQNFAAGQRPMYMNGGWLMGDVIAAAPDGDFGMFPTPWSDDPEQNKLWIGIDDVFIVSQQTEHKDEVMTLLNFFAGEECSKTWMGTAKLMTSNITVPTDDADAFIKEIKTYIDNDMIVSKSLVPDYTSEYSTAFRTKLQEFVTLDDSQRDVTKLLKDIDDEIGSIRQ